MHQAKLELSAIQLAVGQKDVSHLQDEYTAFEKYYMLRNAEESFFKQKSRVKCLQLGDKNTSFFYKAMIQHHNKSAIRSLQREDGSWALGDQEIKVEVVNFFSNLYGQ